MCAYVLLCLSLTVLLSRAHAAADVDMRTNLRACIRIHARRSAAYGDFDRRGKDVYLGVWRGGSSGTRQGCLFQTCACICRMCRERARDRDARVCMREREGEGERERGRVREGEREHTQQQLSNSVMCVCVCARARACVCVCVYGAGVLTLE